MSLVQLLRPDGVLSESEEFSHGLSDADLVELWRRMTLARRLERQAITLTRQGAMAVYPSAIGQEACQVGATFALDEGDWLFPSYRDTVALHMRGVDVVDAMALFQGTQHCGWDPAATRVAPHCTPIATHALHAVGVAMAARTAGDPIVSMTLLGDGATSEGDAHEACNFAAVFDAPCIIFVQNNQFAISVPVAKQTRAASFAARAVGYGMPGYQVDGNDVLAVYAVTRTAVDRARRGEGPTLVEAVTYRIEAHTNADDDARYRSSDEVDEWRAKDPIARLDAFLTREGLLDEAGRTAVEEEAENLAKRMRAEIFDADGGDPGSLFDHAYAEPPETMREQQAFLRRELEG